MVDLGKSVSGSCQLFTVAVRRNLANEKHERASAIFQLSRGIALLGEVLELDVGRTLVPDISLVKNRVDFLLAPQLLSGFGAHAAGTGWQDFIPQLAHGRQVFLDLVRKRLCSNAKKLSEDDVVIMNSFAVIVDELDFDLVVPTSPALWEVVEVVGHARYQCGDGGPVS